MTRGSRRRRAAAGGVASLVTAVLAVVLAATASAGGVTNEQLAAHGWTCFVPPAPFDDRVACFDPGRGRPFPGNLDPAPSHGGVLFDRASGELLGTVHLLRGDLYRGQTCASTGEPYRFIALIGYYECPHVARGG